MKKYVYLICAAASQLFITGICNAQTIDLKPAPSNIIVDGNDNEWSNLADKEKISYQFANDKDNLYLVVKTKDVALQNNILNAGITLSIDTKGRKKHTYTITFPARGQNASNLNINAGQVSSIIELTNRKKIQTEGFKDIKDDAMPVINPSGVKAVIGYDQGYLMYEEIIPLKLFHADGLMDKEWAFNIKVNELQKPDQGSRVVITSMGSTGGGSNANPGNGIAAITGSGRAVYVGRASGYEANKPSGPSASFDFWGGFNLAKTP